MNEKTEWIVLFKYEECETWYYMEMVRDNKGGLETPAVVGNQYKKMNYYKTSANELELSLLLAQ